MTGSLPEQQLDAPTTRNSKKKEPGPLDWTHRPFGGVTNDLKRRGPYYLSDWVDAFRPSNIGQMIASVFFLFFAAVVPAITFGNLYSKNSDQSFGVVETIISTAISGVLYSFFAGQPITVLGATGPIFAYTIVCYNLAVSFDMEFLPFYFWVLMWTSLLTVIIVGCDLCALMHHVTRFSEDIFSGLISGIFIIEAIRAPISSFFDDKKRLDVAFLELILWAFTYRFATFLAGLRRTPWGIVQIRAALANFGVFISICVASALAQIWYDIPIDMLEISSTIQPTMKLKDGSVRGWFVKPMGENGDFPIGYIFFAIVPAIGLSVLGYLDQNLTTVLVNRPSRMLKKPGGYHLDLLIRGIVCTPACAILGLPLAVASTVPSLTHLMALTTYKIEKLPEGERKVPESVCEQRASNLLIHILLGCSLFLSSVLSYVPKAVLFGVFLYMGVASLNGNAFWERFLLLFIWDTKNYPAFEYVEHVNFKRMHFYTAIQIVCWGILYGLNAIKEVAVAFPFFMASLMFLRKFFYLLFSEEELKWLDGEQMDEPEEEELEGLERQVSPWQQNVEPDLDVPFGRGVTPMGKPMQRGVSPFGRGVSTGSGNGTTLKPMQRGVSPFGRGVSGGSGGTPRLPPMTEQGEHGD